jgi:hypothetical protein
MEPIESFTMDEGTDAYGTRKKVIFEGDRIVVNHSFDAKPFIEQAKAERIATDGQRWGDGRKVGTMPMAIYNEYLKIPGSEERKKFVLKWLRNNPAFVTFDRFLK